MAIKRTTRRRFALGLLFLLAVFLGAIALPGGQVILKHIGINHNFSVRKGLDLEGGVSLTYEVEVDQAPKDSGLSTKTIVGNTQRIIERRVNPGGASEATVQTAASNRVIVQIPGLADPADAIKTIGKTAQLQFFEVVSQKGKAHLLPTAISGQDVAKASVQFLSNTSQPIVQLQLKSGQSTKNFADLTGRLAGTPSQLVTLLDGQVVFGPATVQSQIPDGTAQLSGGFDIKQAQEIANLLNAGALPVPVKLVAQQTVGPTLGALAIKQSLIAAVVGLLAVCTLLLIYYRRAGAVAVVSLLFYSIALLSLIKVSTLTPYVIVLTLAGIAGFILSIAVAVDANILIMERVKEELAAGSSPVRATTDGFNHAWTSIRDANATTIISTIILYEFGAPLIKGFALTLGVGVALNLFTAYVVSKLLLRSFSRTRWTNKPKWIGLPVSGARQAGLFRGARK